RDLAVILVVYGVLVLVVTVLAGPNRLAVAFRRSLAPTFRHHPIVVWVAALFFFLILLAVGPTAGNRQLLGVVILAAATAIEALRRQTLREFPENSHPAVGKAPGAT